MGTSPLAGPTPRIPEMENNHRLRETKESHKGQLLPAVSQALDILRVRLETANIGCPQHLGRKGGGHHVVGR